MCLSYADPIPQKHRTRRRWKIFDQDSNGLHSIYFGKYTDIDRTIRETIPVGVWLNEDDFRAPYSGTPCTNNGTRYEVGWHCYEQEPFNGCIDRGVREVRCRKIVATGWQGDKPVTVAKYMMVLPPKEENNGQ